MKKDKKDKNIIKKNKTVPVKSDAESRRDFLNKLWKGLMIVAALEFVSVFFGFLFSGKDNSKKADPKNLMDAGPVESFRLNSVTAFRNGRFYLSRLADGGFIALSLRCTHLGCSINWEDNKNRFICPCHSSAFDKLGNVINSPAPRAMDYFPVIIDAGKVKIDMSQKKKRKKFEKNQISYAI